MLSDAEPGAAKAEAHFELGLFHDNNGREAEAVPHYEAALEGLEGEKRAQCLAWLASSLHKIDRPQEAMPRLQQAKEATGDPDLLRFLSSLEGRIRVKIAMRAATRR
jgi:hypothetical protein